MAQTHLEDMREYDAFNTVRDVLIDRAHLATRFLYLCEKDESGFDDRNSD